MIESKNSSKIYGNDVVAISNINLTIEKGELLLLKMEC